MDDDLETGTITLHNKTYDLAQLNEHERHRLKHEALHEAHKGHESMHAEMVLILLLTLILSQFVLVFWKTRHFKSFQFVTMVGMWTIPFLISLKFVHIRFLIIWIFFSTITSIIFFKASKSPIDKSTPRWLYKWFLLVHKISYVLGVVGYIGLMLTFLGFNFLFFISPTAALDFSIILMFYGVYYGVLGRDIAEICSDLMAAKIGYYSESGIPQRTLENNICAICSNQIIVLNNEDALIEESFSLPCGHIFHEFCIRGWCIVGKKQTCPYCKEKVDLKRLFPNPWEKPHILYGNLLDWIRYLVAWQPVIIILVQGINAMAGLE
jgi:RING finger protein 121